jgi:hypothetical protein
VLVVVSFVKDPAGLAIASLCALGFVSSLVLQRPAQFFFFAIAALLAWGVLRLPPYLSFLKWIVLFFDVLTIFQVLSMELPQAVNVSRGLTPYGLTHEEHARKRQIEERERLEMEAFVAERCEKADQAARQAVADFDEWGKKYGVWRALGVPRSQLPPAPNVVALWEERQRSC